MALKIISHSKKPGVNSSTVFTGYCHRFFKREKSSAVGYGYASGIANIHEHGIWELKKSS